MFAMAPKVKAAQRTSADSTGLFRPHAARSNDATPSPTDARARFSHDFSRIPAHTQSGQTAATRLGIEQLARPGGPAAPTADIRAAAALGTSGAAGALPYLGPIQHAFGQHDVSHVKAYTGAAAHAGPSAMGARAYAVGDRVAFARGANDLHTAAHEAAHVVQQRSGVRLDAGIGAAGDAHECHANAVAAAVVGGKSAQALLDHYPAAASGNSAIQRYEAGEHAKAGDTQDELKKAYAPIKYTVLKGDSLTSIAAKFKISVAELRQANQDKIRIFPAAKGEGTVAGFFTGEQIAIPQNLNEMAREAIQDKSIKVTVNGAALDYGTVIAMGGDLFESPEQMAKTPAAELKAIAALVNEEKQTGKPVSTQRWQLATHDRYGKLAEKNEAHFAPSNPTLVTVSGQSTADHEQSWELSHRKAVAAARAGDKDKALLQNAFGDHFLTDAFSAGHLFNKRDVMEQFNSQLPVIGKGDDRKFTRAGKQFFDAIATQAFVGPVAAEFKKYETFKTHAGLHLDIDSAGMFSRLIQEVHIAQPDLLEGAAVKGIHDTLNKAPGGIMVENALGDKWQLSGDNSLNEKTLAIMHRAVAQSQQNVIAAFRSTAAPDYPALVKQVWDFTPQPTVAGARMVTAAVTSGTDINNKATQAALVALINENYMKIIAELVRLKHLQKIKE